MSDKQKEPQKIKGLSQGTIDVEKLLKKPGTCACGGEYTYIGLGEYRCEGCGDIFKNEYGIVRDFVDQYGTNYSIIEIAEHTGVDKKLIDMFVRNGKFSPVDKQRVCIICHTPILSGLYCNRCALITEENAEPNMGRKNISSGVRSTGDMRGAMYHEKK